MKQKVKKGDWNPVKRPGKLGRMAKRAGVSETEEAEKLAHTKGTSKHAKMLRGEGIFALNAKRGAFKNQGKRKTKRG